MRLPRYTGKPIEPKVKLRFPDRDKLPKMEPFASDADAVKVARRWLNDHYELPEAVSLGPPSVGPSRGGVPEHERDKGICVSFSQCWNGLGTPGYVNIYIDERTVTDANARVELHQFEPIPGTERALITPAEAKKAWMQLLREWGRGKTWADELEPLMKPRLVLAETPMSIDDRDGEGNPIYAPNWLLIDRDVMMMDAHTGELWRNG